MGLVTAWRCGPGTRPPLLDAALLALASSAPAAAAEWHAQPRIHQEFGYDDNYRLSSRDTEAALYSITQLDASLGARSRTLELNLDAGLTYSSYFSSDSTTAHAEHADASIVRRGPRSEASLALGIRQDTTLLDPVNSGDTTSDDQRRVSCSVEPGFTHRLSPLDELSLDAGWLRQIYPGADPDENDGNFVPFSAWNASIGWQRSLTRRLKLGAQLAGSRFDSSRDDAVSLGPMLTASYRYTDVIDLSLATGPSYYRSNSQERVNGRLETDESSGLGYALDAKLGIAVTHRTRLNLIASNKISAGSNNGIASQIGTLGADLNHELSPFLRLTLSLLYLNERAVGGGSSTDGSSDRDFMQAGIGITWHLNERLQASLDYRFRHNEQRGDGGGTAVSNAVFARFAYSLQEMRAAW